MGTYTRRLPRHFITGTELSPGELNALIDRALELKAAPYSSDALRGRVVALLFQKPSTRTRVSFEAGIAELGGHPMVLRPEELQLSRGESIRDTAYVLSRHVAAIGIRTGDEDLVTEMAEHATVPVINMLTPGHHPCQVLADLLTLREAFGRLEGLTVAYVGDGNNVARSLLELGTAAGLRVRIYTDAWVSMSDAPESASERRRVLAPYRLDEQLLDEAAPHAIALHCLPAHPGEEISEQLLYGERQRIWDQAENRRHAQKALLESLIDAGRGHVE